MDKNTQFIKYIRQCPQIERLYVSFAEAKDSTRSFIPLTNDSAVKTFIDGSKLKYYSFALTDYSLANTNPVPLDDSKVNKNIIDLADLQLIIDWFNTQNEKRNYPDFGNNCKIESIYSLTDNPTIAGLDQTGLAKYMIQIRCEYIEERNDNEV